MNDLCFFVTMIDGVTHVHGYASTVGEYEFFHDVANEISFGDCTGADVVQIVWHGNEVKYDGWRRQEYFGFSDLNGECVFGNCFMEFEH